MTAPGRSVGGFERLSGRSLGDAPEPIGVHGVSTAIVGDTTMLTEAQLSEAQISVLCDIAQSVAFADNSHGEVDQLIREGYVVKDGDLYELTPKAEKVLSDRGAGLNEA